MTTDREPTIDRLWELHLQALRNAISCRGWKQAAWLKRARLAEVEIARKVGK